MNNYSEEEYNIFSRLFILKEFAFSAVEKIILINRAKEKKIIYNLLKFLILAFVHLQNQHQIFLFYT